MKYFTSFIILSALWLSCTNKKDERAEYTRVVVNPFSTAPLTAVIQVCRKDLPPAEVQEINVRVLGKQNGNGLPGIDIAATLYPHTDAFKKNFFDITRVKKYNGTVITSRESVEIPVLGLYPDYNNTVVFEIISDSVRYTDTLMIQTGPLPDTTLTIVTPSAMPEKMEDGDVTWLTADGYFLDIMFDHQGEIRWYINTEGNSDFRVLDNNNFIVKNWWYERDIGEYTRLGESVSRYTLPPGYYNHHDVIELPDGNLLLPVSVNNVRPEGYKTIQDGIIELDRESREVVNNWDLFELMDIAHLEAAWRNDSTHTPGDWFHMNSICYDRAKDEIIVSGKHGGVIKLTRNGENGDSVNRNKAIVWYMPAYDQYSIYAGHPAVKDKILTAVDAEGRPYADQSLRHKDFHWTMFQHDPTIIPSGDGLLHFLIFNNVYDDHRSAAVEYAVDEVALTVSEYWQYGRDNPKLFAGAWSGVCWLPETDNRLLVPAWNKAPKTEVTREGEVVFEFMALTDTLSPYWYRGGRIHLYP